MAVAALAMRQQHHQQDVHQPAAEQYLAAVHWREHQAAYAQQRNHHIQRVVQDQRSGKHAKWHILIVRRQQKAVFNRLDHPQRVEVRPQLAQQNCRVFAQPGQTFRRRIIGPLCRIGDRRQRVEDRILVFVRLVEPPHVVGKTRFDRNECAVRLVIAPCPRSNRQQRSQNKAHSQEQC